MIKCIHCDSYNIIKFGKINNKQQYYCKDCNKHFTENSNPKRGLIIDNKKYCSCCESFKPISDFFMSDGVIRSKCKKCYNIKNNSRYRNHKLNGVNLNEKIFIEIVNSQNNKCAICGREFKSNKHTFIDHNHQTGEVRGLLCPKCNMILGMCDDNIETLKNAISYLTKNELVVNDSFGKN